MEERRKTLAAITVLVGIFVFIIIIIGVILSSNKVVSPLQDEQVLRVIFISPTPEIEQNDSTDSGILKETEL